MRIASNGRDQMQPFIRKFNPLCRAIAVALPLVLSPLVASAQLDGHGPDAWRVADVSASDTLNVRMGPGTQYPVIDRFAHDERGLRQVTCVPFFGPGGDAGLSEAERAALPPRWCLMQHADLMRAGWVAQRFITPDDTVAVPAAAPGDQASSGDDMIDEAEDLVRALYEMHTMSFYGGGPSPLDPEHAGRFFAADVVAWLRANPLQADPLFDAQDFDGSVDEPYRDPQQPMFRGMITVLVDFTNFGQRRQAVVRLRADTMTPGSPVRVMRIEHDGWSFP